MVGFELRLSSKIGVDGRSQVYVKLTLGPSTRPCFKSGVYIKPKWWKATKTSRGNKYRIVPPSSAKNDIDAYDAIDAKNRLSTFCNTLLRICQITEEHDKDKLTRQWVDVTYHMVVKHGIALRNINYNVLEQFYAEAVRTQVLPGKKTYKGGFFKLINAYRESHPRGTTSPKLLQLGRILYRYERYIALTDPKRPKFLLDADYFDQFTLIEFQNYMLNEEQMVVNSGKLIEILKPCPDLPVCHHAVVSHTELRRGQNTVSSHMIAFKAFYTWLQDMNITKKEPFRGFVNPSVKLGVPFYLTVDERNKVAEHDFGGDIVLTTTRDMFMFQCHTGCRYSDFSGLTPLNINGDMLVYYPRKTKELVRSSVVKVPLSETAKELIRRYNGIDDKGRLFPVPRCDVYNKSIKKVIKACGIDRTVPVRNSITGQEEMKPIYEVSSSHMARRTFIGAAYKAVKDPNLISKMSGHIEGSKAFTRYRNIDEDDLRDVIDLIQ